MAIRSDFRSTAPPDPSAVDVGTPLPRSPVPRFGSNGGAPRRSEHRRMAQELRNILQNNGIIRVDEANHVVVVQLVEMCANQTQFQ